MLHLTARAVTAWGFAFRFQSDHHALVDLVEYCYRDLPDAPGPAAAITVRKTGRGGHGLAMTVQHPDGTIEPCGEGRTLEEMPELLWWEVNRRARASAADRVVLHAATIADDRGAWLLCAGSQVGKSTLAAANALRHGRHLSDDMALLADDTATVLPYARPLMLRPGGREVLVAAGRPDGAVVLPPGDAPRLAVHGDEWFLPASALGATVPAGRFIQPRIEAEIAFVMKTALGGAAVTRDDVLAATDYVAPSIEILDTRITRVDAASGEARKIFDTISDNAANAGVVLGPERHQVAAYDLRWVGAIVSRDGNVEETGLGAGVLNDPVESVVWLARRMAQYGQRIEAGHIILSGSFIRPVECPPGAHVHANFGFFGGVDISFE